MLPAPCFVISDVHLGFAPAETERSLIAFLRQLPGHASSLVINGDLFEFWFEWKTVIPRRSFRVLAALADVHDAGIPILMIAGNHDCWGDEVLRTDVGLDYRFGPWEGGLAGWHTRIEHGDGLRKREDRRYRLLRRVIRNRFAIRAFRWLHPDLGTAMATHSSQTSRNYQARDRGRGLERIALSTLAADARLDLVLFGHSHVATLVRAPSGSVYANAGSWLDAPTYLRILPERIELRQWNGSAEGLHLDALDRAAKKALA